MNVSAVFAKAHGMQYEGSKEAGGLNYSGIMPSPEDILEAFGSSDESKGEDQASSQPTPSSNPAPSAAPASPPRTTDAEKDEDMEGDVPTAPAADTPQQKASVEPEHADVSMEIEESNTPLPARKGRLLLFDHTMQPATNWQSWSKRNSGPSQQPKAAAAATPAAPEAAAVAAPPQATEPSPVAVSDVGATAAQSASPARSSKVMQEERATSPSSESFVSAQMPRCRNSFVMVDMCVMVLCAGAGTCSTEPHCCPHNGIKGKLIRLTIELSVV